MIPFNASKINHEHGGPKIVVINDFKRDENNSSMEKEAVFVSKSNPNLKFKRVKRGASNLGIKIFTLIFVLFCVR